MRTAYHGRLLERGAAELLAAVGAMRELLEVDEAAEVKARNQAAGEAMEYADTRAAVRDVPLWGRLS
jgi:hypothetical protein